MVPLIINKESCQYCYKCLRVCPVKAIKTKNDNISIVDERCIYCGQCFMVCPQREVRLQTDLPSIKLAIKEGRQVVASVSSSYFAAFDLERGEQLVTALKELGFRYVEETAIGADIVSSLYECELKSNKYKNIITTTCPSVNLLIEKYYPSLIEYMLPIASPMIAHGKVLKNTYGMDSYVVYIGPCISKKAEVDEPQNDDYIDAVLTFQELDQWLSEERIELLQKKTTSFDQRSTERGRAYDLVGGVLNSFIKDNKDLIYDVVSIDGIEECIDFLDTMIAENITNACVELNACSGGCINGPCMPNKYSKYRREKRMKDYIKSRDTSFTYKKIEFPENIDFRKSFSNKSFPRPEFTEDQIKNVLKSIDKYSQKDELNCSICGYTSCREKAKAVLEEMAEINICFPNIKNKGERLSNHVFERSPNAIFVIDNNLNVLEFNPVCEKVFDISAEDIIGYPISKIFDDSIFAKARDTKEDIVVQKVNCEKYGVVFLQNIINIHNKDAMLVIMTDITMSDRDKEELRKIKENTLNAAQDVIDKQMRVAQEIAGLLGETTAETKVVLTKLKKLVIEDGDVK